MSEFIVNFLFFVLYLYYTFKESEISRNILYIIYCFKFCIGINNLNKKYTNLKKNL